MLTMRLRVPLPHQVEAAAIAACESYNVDRAQLFSKSNRKECTHTRQLFWLILAREARASERGIGGALPTRFGKTAVRSGINTAAGLVEVDGEYRERVARATEIYYQHCKK